MTKKEKKDIEEKEKKDIKKNICECGYEGEYENVTGVLRCPVCHKE